jgi:hypothetical protein
MNKLINAIKIFITTYLIVTSVININAQEFKGLDKAPQDIAYFRESRVTKPLVKVIYGRPSIKNDEQAFGSKIPYDKLWRTGANEATEIKLYEDVFFGDCLVEAGLYTLLTIPGENNWEIILNKNLDVLGAFQYNPSDDVIKISIPVVKAERLEVFSIGFKRKENKILMVLAWDSARIKIPLKFVKQRHYAKL